MVELIACVKDTVLSLVACALDEDDVNADDTAEFDIIVESELAGNVVFVAAVKNPGYDKANVWGAVVLFILYSWISIIHYGYPMFIFGYPEFIYGFPKFIYGYPIFIFGCP